MMSQKHSLNSLAYSWVGLCGLGQSTQMIALVTAVDLNVDVHCFTRFCAHKGRDRGTSSPLYPKQCPRNCSIKHTQTAVVVFMHLSRKGAISSWFKSRAHNYANAELSAPHPTLIIAIWNLISQNQNYPLSQSSTGSLSSPWFKWHLALPEKHSPCSFLTHVAHTLTFHVLWYQCSLILKAISKLSLSLTFM